MFKLYQTSMSVCCQKVRFVLAEKQLDFGSTMIDLAAGGQYSPEYRSLNRNSVVPTLIHNEEVLIESSVILYYLEEVFPEPMLMPDSPLERTKVRLWIQELDVSAHDNIAILTHAIALRHGFLKRNKTEAERIAIYASWSKKRRERQEQIIEMGVESQGFVDALHAYMVLLNRMEQSLEINSWLACDEMSLADASYVPYILRLEHLGLESLWTNRPKLSNWYDKVRQTTGYITGVEKWFDHERIKMISTASQIDAKQIQKMILAA